MQCPHCKFYKTHCVYLDHKEVGREPNPVGTGDSLFTIAIYGGIIFLIYFIGAAIVTVGSFIFLRNAVVAANVIWALLTVVVSALLFSTYLKKANTRTKAIEQIIRSDYECRHCGYEWSIYP